MLGDLNNLSVSWVRGRDSHIRTVDRDTFISDNRFISTIKKEKIYNVITLVIYEVQIQDQGNYECEVSSQPTILRIIELIVLEPE